MSKNKKEFNKIVNPNAFLIKLGWKFEPGFASKIDSYSKGNTVTLICRITGMIVTCDFDNLKRGVDYIDTHRKNLMLAFAAKTKEDSTTTALVTS